MGGNMKKVAMISVAAMSMGFVHGAAAADLGVRTAPVYQPAPVVVAPTAVLLSTASP
jgi:hypothetical protein